MPAWSPDDSALVFSSPLGAQHPYYELVQYSIAGLTSVQLTTNAYDDLVAAWSPMGNAIAWAARQDGGKVDLWITSTDGRVQTRLREWGDAPAWSPDGLRIAFAGRNMETNTMSLWILDLATGDASRLTQ